MICQRKYMIYLSFVSKGSAEYQILCKKKNKIIITLKKASYSERRQIQFLISYRNQIQIIKFKLYFFKERFKYIIPGRWMDVGDNESFCISTK